MGLTADYLQDVADQLVPLHAQLEEDILTDVARRIAKAGRITETAAWQARKMQEAGIVRRSAIRKAAKMTGQTTKTLMHVFDTACTKAIDADDEIYQAAGLKLVPLSADQSFRQIMLAGIQKTQGLFNNLTMTSLNSAGSIYTATMDRAYMQVISGAFSFDDALKRAITSLARDGITQLTYESGAVSSADAAARRSLLTGLNQTTAQLQLHRAEQLGSDLVEVTAHLGARPTHAVWQGGIYSLTGNNRHYRNFYDETGYGTGEGLCGWNCYHNFFPFFEGLSGRTFTENTHTIKGKTNDQVYEESQRQRALERAVRASKREIMVLDAARKEAESAELKEYLDREFRRASLTLRNRRDRLDGFLEETGRRMDQTRIFTPDFSMSTSSKAVWAARRAAGQ